MPAAVNTLLIEGSFEELCEELAQYIDNVNNTQGQQTSVQQEIQPLLQEGKKEDALKKIVSASPALNNAPERGWSYKNGRCQMTLTTAQNSSPHTTF